ncbi:hypothetical protein GGR56DRAFT_678692 [Xylariaceae sp. FL0804]|nr:hypothetical protein GGR56DRAFT_678692 [Xylariaceae sp. FL0804]
MRQALAEGCEDSFEWKRHIAGYELTAEGVCMHRIRRRSVVGGEGIYSKVVKQLSSKRLRVDDTSARGIHGQAPSAALKVLGEGVFQARDDTRSDGGSPRKGPVTLDRAEDEDNVNENEEEKTAVRRLRRRRRRRAALARHDEDEMI